MEMFSDFDDPQPTIKTVRKVIERMKQTGTRRVVVVAAPMHKWRVMRDLHKLGEEAGLQFFISTNKGDWIKHRMWYCKDSSQWWTRSWGRWWFYESLVRLLPFSLYVRLSDKETSRDTRFRSLFR
jgi:hypothetical protein